MIGVRVAKVGRVGKGLVEAVAEVVEVEVMEVV